MEDNERRHIEFESFFFTSPEQIKMARQFASSFVLVTDATFNTNENRLPLSVIVAVTHIMTSFPVAYCYVKSKSETSFLFLGESMKDLFFYDQCRGPRIVLGDFAAGLIAAFTKKLSPSTMEYEMSFKLDAMDSTDCLLQHCNWHAAEAIKAKLTKEGYLSDLRRDLHSLVWTWIKSVTESEADSNRDILLEQLREQEKEYLLSYYERKKRQFITAYTKRYPNLGCASTQRGESMHPVIKNITNRHTPMHLSVKAIVNEVEELSRKYDDEIGNQRRNLPQIISQDRHSFGRIMTIVIHSCLQLIFPEFNKAKKLALDVVNGEVEEDLTWGHSCTNECLLPMQYSLPCMCWLYRCAKYGKQIPLSLVHPRWLFDAPELVVGWQMSYCWNVLVPRLFSCVD